MRWATLVGGATATTSHSKTHDVIEHSTDVLVIGAGPAGICIADKLTAKDMDVLLVESGVDEPDQEHQSLNDVTGSVSPIQQGLGFAGRRAVGGTSHVWGGICPRFDESDFRTASEFGYGIDWPISFAELSRYYCEAEAWLRVANIRCANSARSRLISRSIS